MISIVSYDVNRQCNKAADVAFTNTEVELESGKNEVEKRVGPLRLVYDVCLFHVVFSMDS